MEGQSRGSTNQKASLWVLRAASCNAIIYLSLIGRDESQSLRVYIFLGSSSSHSSNDHPFSSQRQPLPHFGASPALTVPCIVWSECLTDIMATLWKHSDGRRAEMLGWIAIHNIYSSSEGRNLAFTDFPPGGGGNISLHTVNRGAERQEGTWRYVTNTSHKKVGVGSG